MKTAISLKDQLFNQVKVQQLALDIQKVYPAFKAKAFTSSIVRAFPDLALKARITCIAQHLRYHLPPDYSQALEVILAALPPPNDPSLSDDDFGDFIYAAYAEFVALYGCQSYDVERSLSALHAITQRFSAEYAIRVFINHFPDITFDYLQRWSIDPHYHVRRLVSEGTRPKLPWGKSISSPITQGLALLDTLFTDSTSFVLRSVANHLNDVSKINPDLVIKTLIRWQSSQRQSPHHLDFLIQHSLRSLIKKGNPQALSLIGVSPNLKLSLLDIKIPKKVQLNTALEFSFSIAPLKTPTLIVADYILHFPHASKKTRGKKVFKLKKCWLPAQQALMLSKRHLLKENMSTRLLIKGEYALELQINGRSYGSTPFAVT